MRCCGRCSDGDRNQVETDQDAVARALGQVFAEPAAEGIAGTFEQGLGGLAQLRCGLGDGGPARSAQPGDEALLLRLGARLGLLHLTEEATSGAAACAGLGAEGSAAAGQLGSEGETDPEIDARATPLAEWHTDSGSEPQLDVSVSKPEDLRCDLGASRGVLAWDIL